jgi:Tfp pilus assembly protein PilO
MCFVKHHYCCAVTAILHAAYTVLLRSYTYAYAQAQDEANRLHQTLAAKESELVKLQSNIKQHLAMKDAGMAELKAQLRLV